MASRSGSRGLRRVAAYVTYFDLVSSGVGYAEAAERVGVSRSTGSRWRLEASGVDVAERDHQRRQQRRERDQPEPQVGLVPPPVEGRGRYLSLDERVFIADALIGQWGVRAIARALDRAASTVSREVRRNQWTRHPEGIGPSGRPGSSGSSRRYGPFAADRAAAARRRRPKARKLETDLVLRALVGRWLLKLRWSPRQIAHRLRRVFPDQPERHLAHETIYQAIYVQGRGALRRELAAALRQGRAQRRPHRDPNARQARFSEPMVMISERPAEADDRAVPGHWEGDLILGAGNASAIATLVERHTRYVRLAALPAGRHDAAAVRDALITAMAGLPASLARSLTWDQGAEMARHHEFSLATGIPVYFCEPASPWMRGSNENTNGLLRQYFPKGTDLAVHSQAYLDAVADQLNGRPRETLGWDDPAQRLASLLANSN
jgi:transposase, IS30 family